MLKSYKRERKNFINRGEIVLCLLGMAILSSVVLYIKSELNNSNISFHVILIIKVLIWLFWGCWLPLIFFLSQKIPIHKNNTYKGLLLHIPVSIFIVCIHILVYAAIIKFSPIPSFNNQPLDKLFFGFLFSQFEWYFMTYWALILGSYAFNFYYKFQHSDTKSAQLETLLTKAKLNALKIQLKPHFLFNTLNTISSLVRQEENDKSILMLSELGDLLRLVIDNNEQQFVPLSNEIRLIKKYIALEELRFKSKLRVTIDVDERIDDAMVPSFILQPLIENSIYHGLSQKIDAKWLTIEIKKDNDTLNFMIYNDGFPLPEDFHITKTKGIGIANSIERLSQLYKDDYYLEIFNFKKGVMTELSIPFIK